MSEPLYGAISASLSSQVRSLLRALAAADAEIDSSAVMTGDGNLIAATLHAQTDGDRYAAMCASLLALADRAAQEVDRGDLSQVLVGGAHGSMLLVRAGPRAVLAISASPHAQIGRILMEARRAAEKLRELLGG